MATVHDILLMSRKVERALCQFCLRGDTVSGLKIVLLNPVDVNIIPSQKILSKIVVH